VLDGRLGFCDVVFGWDMNDAAYDNVKFTGWHTGYPDAPVKVDINSFRKIPWEDDLPFFLGDFINEKNEPLYVCPRQLLAKIEAQCKRVRLHSIFLAGI
jgi:glutamine synthetase